MSSDTALVLAFDIYETLVDTHSTARDLRPHLQNPDDADQVATLWRRHQTEYTFRLNSMNRFLNFRDVTIRALEHALLEVTGQDLPSSAKEAIMAAQKSLDIFADVPAGLRALQSSSDGVTATTKSGRPVIVAAFSNGTRAMVEAILARPAPGLGPFRDVFGEVIVVEDVARYKPATEVYGLLVEQTGAKKRDVVLVSGNAFDIVGARESGCGAVWVDRTGRGMWMDRLGGGQEEMFGEGIAKVVGGVNEAVDWILETA